MNFFAHAGESHEMVTSDTDSAGTGLDSALLVQGESYILPITRLPNLYPCSPHPQMKGSVTVGE